jgi:poly(3-hydroxybutyrate) depolymerase
VTSFAWRTVPFLALVACGEAAPTAPDAGAPDAAPRPDASAPPAPDAGAADAGAADASLPPLAPPEPLAALEPWDPGVPWLVTTIGPGGPDPLAGRFLEKRIELPEGPGSALGVTWSEQTPNADGQFVTLGQQRIYAGLRVEVTAPLHLSARLVGFELLVDGVRLHEPDPYRTGRVRHPVYLGPGTHELVVRGSNQRGPPSVRFARASGPLQPNLQDVTRPDLLSGETAQAPLGVHVLNTSGRALSEVDAVVLESELFATTARRQAPLPAGAVTAMAFDLVSKGPIPAGVDTATLTLGLQARELSRLYTFELALPVTARDRSVRRTFISGIDGSAQYYAVNGPPVPPSDPAALVLSLHGASVEAAGQARAYETKDWAYVVAPTNRRPFGFDWQDWGRLDALEVLAEARRTLPVDPLQVYLTGHSMGGHGTWHLGVLHSDRFAVFGPSAGWIAFDTYGGSPDLPPAWDAGRLHDDTLRYKANLAERGVYIIHGDADRNVPVEQGRRMFRELMGIVSELYMHEEPGARHWWDGDPRPGARCVDFPPLFDLMRRSRRDPMDLDFDFVSPAPWVSPRHRYVTVEAARDPYRPFEVQSRRSGSRVTLTTDNVASVVLDGDALAALGVTEAVVDGEARAVDAGPLRFGAAEKRPGVHGPIKEVFFRPFCFIHDDGDAAWAARAATLTSIWAVIGNGAACTLPFSRRAEAGDRNRIYLGLDSSRIGLPARAGITFDADAVAIDGEPTGRPTFVAVTFPEGDHLAVALAATRGAEWLAGFFQPFSSRAAFPDWFTYVLNDQGNPAYGPSGWFDATWSFDPSLAR